MSEIQYISDANGNPTGVIVPIDLWNEIESEKETAYLLKSEEMKKRLVEAKDREEGITFEEAQESLGFDYPQKRNFIDERGKNLPIPHRT